MVVGIGVVGRAGERAVALEPTIVIASVAPALAGADPRQTVARLIVIESPATTNAVITSPDLVVRGYVLSGTGPIDIVLESSGNKTLATKTVQPMSGSGALFSGGRSSFSATFPLSNPRPGGRMVIQVIAFDHTGRPLESLRRRIRIGAIDP